MCWCVLVRLAVRKTTGFLEKNERQANCLPFALSPTSTTMVASEEGNSVKSYSRHSNYAARSKLSEELLQHFIHILIPSVLFTRFLWISECAGGGRPSLIKRSICGVIAVFQRATSQVSRKGLRTATGWSLKNSMTEYTLYAIKNPLEKLPRYDLQLCTM